MGLQVNLPPPRRSKITPDSLEGSWAPISFSVATTKQGKYTLALVQHDHHLFPLLYIYEQPTSTGQPLPHGHRECGARTENTWVKKISLSSSSPLRLFHLDCDGGPRGPETLRARAVIVSTGADARRLGCKGEDKYWTKGVSACAVCDGSLPLFRNQPVAVVGGGDSAMEEALHLANHARRVFVIHRRDELRASRVLQDRVLSHPKIELVWSAVVDEVLGDEKTGLVNRLRLKSTRKEGEKQQQQQQQPWELSVAGMFVAVGHRPNTGFLVDSGGDIAQVVDQATGYMRVLPGTTKTTVEGLYGAGDVADSRYRQAVTAAGLGCMAALDAEKYLQESGDRQPSVEPTARL